ncbi:MAG TPA: double zinc ribbon domain-containing protein [bacterium]|nr:double zinc ribbon domain-containing protein [bacterium]
MKKIKQFIQILLDFLFPKYCILCQKKNDNFLCFNCFKTITFKDPSCPNCNTTSHIGEFCPACQNKFSLRGVLSAGDFSNKNLNIIIKNYKYKFVKDLAYPLALYLSTFLENNFLPSPILKNISTTNILVLSDFLLIPVPLSKKRQRWRDFNHSELLAKIIAKKFNLKLSLDLKKIKDTSNQATLEKEKRINNLTNSFKWQGPSLKGQKILIIDDVCTTISTLNEIASELKKHQAGEIWGLVLAKG